MVSVCYPATVADLDDEAVVALLLKAQVSPQRSNSRCAAQGVVQIPLLQHAGICASDEALRQRLPVSGQAL